MTFPDKSWLIVDSGGEESRRVGRESQFGQVAFKRRSRIVDSKGRGGEGKSAGSQIGSTRV